MGEMIVERYNAFWKFDSAMEPDEMSLRIEMDCIRLNGNWKRPNGVMAGNGLGNHYEAMRHILWPRLDNHRWNQLMRETILKEKVTIIAGPASSGKTHTPAWMFLCEYMCWPEVTCVLVSSTDLRGLRGRIWSEITMLWQEARDRFEWLPGNLLDSKVAILTDDLDENEYDRGSKKARNYRKCIQGVPCREDGAWVGLNRYMGWKQKRMRLIGDELSQMSSEFITGISNLNANPDFKFVGLGNFNDPMDCLGRCAEPADGWSNHMEPMKTEVWDTFYPLKGKCINLIGFDSPNFDTPRKSKDVPERYPYLIGERSISEVEAGYGRQSIEFMSQCWGAMKVSTLSFRVLNRELCSKGRAFDEPDWAGNDRHVKIGALDAAWGGDRCTFLELEFGRAVNGQMIVALQRPLIVPVRAGEGLEPDYSIAEWVKAACEERGIPPENFFHDSTGRGSLGTALARVWSSACNPVEFGGKPTDRPVSLDTFTTDLVTRRKRLKLCSEHYVKRVTEMWFSVRYCVEAGQVRGLPQEVMEEFAMRIWRRVQNDKIEIESKSGTKEKPGMKQRTGRSPDLADVTALAIEGARTRGFQISKLANESWERESNPWLKDAGQRAAKAWRAHDLVEA